jgi:hypothetical protein
MEAGSEGRHCLVSRHRIGYQCQGRSSAIDVVLHRRRPAHTDRPDKCSIHRTLASVRTVSKGVAVHSLTMAQIVSPIKSTSFAYAERSTLENARRYDTGLVPTTFPKCSRITAADPKPVSAATCSMARSVVSSSR